MSGALQPIGLQRLPDAELPLDESDYFAVQQGTSQLAKITKANLAIAILGGGGGVTPGVYSKVHVNADGIVTLGEAIDAADVEAALTYTPVSAALLAVPNGVATLDGTGVLAAAQIPPALLSGLSPQGTWNAATNTPALTSGVGTSGHFYVVSVAGTTSLNGIAVWNIGDWALFSGSAWTKVPSAQTLGTLALQNADDVDITGGTLANVSIIAAALTAPVIANGTASDLVLTGGTAAGIALDSPITTGGTSTGEAFHGVIMVGGTASGLALSGSTITGGTASGLTISASTFSGAINGATLSGGTIAGAAINGGTATTVTIAGGTASAIALLTPSITGGTAGNIILNTPVLNSGSIAGTIAFSGTLQGAGGGGGVIAGGTLAGGRITGTITNGGVIQLGTIAGASLSGIITNRGTISGGIINGATLAAGSILSDVANSTAAGPLPATGLEQFLLATTALTAAPVRRYPLPSILSTYTGYIVETFGGRGDLGTYTGALTVAAGTNPTVTIPGTDLSKLAAAPNGGAGQLVVLPLGGAAGAGVIATVASVLVGSSQIVLTGTVATSLSNIAFQATGSPTIAAAGTDVTPGDVYTPIGGDFTVLPQIVAMSTKVVGIAANTNGGSGTDGAYTFTGTSPGKQKFTFTANIVGGALDPTSIVPVLAGVYQQNPPATKAEPVITTTPSGLVGATVALTMGANGTQIQGQPSSLAIVTVPGGGAAVPSNPVLMAGPGSGVQMNISWATPQVLIGTDNINAINAALDAIRANGIVNGNKVQATAQLLFAGDSKRYLISRSANTTGLTDLIVRGQRAVIHSIGSGDPVFDALSTANSSFEGVTIEGDPTFPPRWPFQFGRIDSSTAAYNRLDQIVIRGTFTDAGLEYNFASEGLFIGLVRMNFTAPWGRIQDAANSSVWNVTSRYVTQTLQADRAQSFEGGNPHTVSMINNHPAGSGEWILGGIDHSRGRGSYTFAHQFGVVIQASSLQVPVGLTLETHFEAARNAVYVALPASNFDKTPNINRLTIVDSSLDCTEAMFGQDAAIKQIKYHNCHIRTAFTGGSNAPLETYFSDPTKIDLSGDIFGSDGSGQWTGSPPASFVGWAYLGSAGVDTELIGYGASTADDFSVGGVLTVAGTIQSFGQILTSDGTVGSISVSLQGIYQNPDYPSCTIDPPPPGGTQALAAITGMTWNGVGDIIAGGSGFAPSQVLTFVGGVFTTPAQIQVTAVDGIGKVTAWRGKQGGSYSTYPPAGATTVTGGTGTGFIFSPLLFSLLRSGVTIIDPGGGYTVTPPKVKFSASVDKFAGARGTAVMNHAAWLDSAGLHLGRGVGLDLNNGGTGAALRSLTYVTGDAALEYNAGGTIALKVADSGTTELAALKVTGRAGFNGTAPIAKPAVTGSRAGNAALASLLTQLASYGLLTDSTSA